MKRVYFMRPVGMDGPVKIGVSAEPIKRLKAIAIWSPFPLEIVAAFPGTEEDECALHGLFAADRLHGEWFQASADLTELMDRVRRGEPIDRLDPAFVEAKSAMRVASGLKSALTLRLHKAEKRAQQRGLGVIRPDHIRQAICEYTGPDKPAPTDEHHALIGLHVRELELLERHAGRAA